MNYKETRQYIQAVQTGAAIQPGLETISLLLSKIGNPQDACSFIHLAGTNGKGSTGTFITNVLAQSGRKIGRYFSPALFSKNETIQWNQGEKTHYITEEEYEAGYVRIGEAIREMKEKGQSVPTDFEIETALAFLAFSEWKCDLEKFLGDTIEEIAVQKAGIITNAAPVVTVQESSEALQVIQNRCEEKKAPLYVLNRKEISGLSCEAGETKFCYRGETYTIRMCGQYQVENACLALLALQVLEPLPPEIIQKGMAEARWLGRFDYVKKSPVWIADGAHNPQGMESLLASLRQMYPDKKRIGIMGVFADKDHRKMCQKLAEDSWFQKIFTIQAPGPRGLSAESLAEELASFGMQSRSCTSLAEAVEEVKELQKMEENGTVVVCFGSLSFMKELYQIMGE